MAFLHRNFIVMMAMGTVMVMVLVMMRRIMNLVVSSVNQQHKTYVFLWLFIYAFVA